MITNALMDTLPITTKSTHKRSRNLIDYGTEFSSINQKKRPSNVSTYFQKADTIINDYPSPEAKLFKNNRENSRNQSFNFYPTLSNSISNVYDSVHSKESIKSDDEESRPKRPKICKLTQFKTFSESDNPNNLKISVMNLDLTSKRLSMATQAVEKPSEFNLKLK